MSNREEFTIEKILKEMGIIEYDPECVSQLLDTVKKLAIKILEDAHYYSNNKEQIDVGDIRLAIQLQEEETIFRPSTTFLKDTSKTINLEKLPNPEINYGIKVPSNCLNGVNFKLKKKVERKIPSTNCTADQTQNDGGGSSGNNAVVFKVPLPVIKIAPPPKRPKIISQYIDKNGTTIKIAIQHPIKRPKVVVDFIGGPGDDKKILKIP